VPAILHLLKNYQIKGIAHITGGGFYENIPRILPQNLSVNIYTDRWPLLPIFKLIQDKGKITYKEMFHTFNMGLGLVIVTVAEQQQSIVQDLKQSGESAYLIGEVVSRKEPNLKIF
jgi:phosphoribosylformylglycinamidine cyclo-ligase